MLHAATREGLFCSTYCLMPDHLHLVWMGLRLDTDQLNGMAFLRTHLEPALAPAKFQPQAHDRVLRAEQRRKNAFAEVCRYDLNNPVRAGLVANPGAWRFNRAVVPGYPRLHPLEPDYWPTFWKLFAKARHPDAGNLVRPPFNLGSPPRPSIAGDDVRSLANQRHEPLPAPRDRTSYGVSAPKVRDSLRRLLQYDPWGCDAVCADQVR